MRSGKSWTERALCGAALTSALWCAAASPAAAVERLPRPLHFEPNRGQTNRDVRFLARSSEYTLFLTATEAVLKFPKGDPGALRVEFVDANRAANVVGVDERPGRVHYYVGNNPAGWHTGIPTYARVRTERVWPGIDVVYYGTEGRIEMDLVVEPGTHPDRIRLRVPDSVPSVSADGDLVVGGDGGLRLSRPVVYQEADGVRQPVDGRYVVGEDGLVSFRIGEYDPSRALVIDPVLAYSTYLGGSGSDSARGIAVDAAGNAYVTGETGSADFPLRGAFQTGGPSGGDTYAFVSKLNASGSELVYSTYIGGGQFHWNFPHATNQGNGIAVDAAGNAYVAGTTNSVSFPNANGLYSGDGKIGWGEEYYSGFVVKLGPSGTLAYATLLGGVQNNAGTGDAFANAIAVDDAGNFYVAGETRDKHFPLQSPVQAEKSDGSDAFVTKFNSTGRALLFSTYLGGAGSEGATGIALDAVRNVYVAGTTDSPNFPTTPTALQTSRHGAVDAFVAKLSASGGFLVYSTYLGGGGNEYGNGIVVDAEDSAYVTGLTSSTDFPLPADPGASLYPTKRGANDAFVARLSAGGSALRYATYLGGRDRNDAPAYTAAWGIARAPSGVWVTGGTGAADFPTTPDAYLTSPPGEFGGSFLTQLNVAQNRLEYSTYFPRSTSALAAGTDGAVYVTGGTSAADFPTTDGAFDRTYGGGTCQSDNYSYPCLDAIVLKFGAPTCGNGTIDDGEECDDGADNSDTESNACRTDCTLPRCGDNVVDDGPPNYEDCDDGNRIDGDDCPTTCKLPMVLSPRLVLGKGLCADQPQKLELREAGTNRDITTAPDVTYEWVKNEAEQTVLNGLLKTATGYLKEKAGVNIPDLKMATIEVVNGEVRFAAGKAGIGVNVIQAKRDTPQGEIRSNRAFVISGMRLVKAGSLKIQPVSLANVGIDIVSDLITRAFGNEMPDPPMVLFSEGPCNDALSFVGRTGKVVIREFKFDLFGGLIKDADLIGGVEKAIGWIPGVGGSIGKFVKATVLGVAGEALDFEVSSKAAETSEKKEKKAPVTSDSVIEVTDSLSKKAPFFSGVVTAKNPGLSAVQATMDLGKCLGKATDDMLVWVTPRLENLEIRNEGGRKENPLHLAVNGSRPAHAVGMLNAFQDGTQPVEIPFDPIDILPGEAGELKKVVENWIPGGKDFLGDMGIPVEITYPERATAPAGGFYAEGDSYFHLKLTYNPLAPSITISDLRLQAAIPNFPLVTTWSMPVPPNPPTPVAEVETYGGTLTGKTRGDGQVKVDVCVPFLTNNYSSATNGVRVVGDEILVTGTVFDDRNGNGVLDNFEQGIGPWTVDVLSGNGNVIASGTTGGDGGYSILVAQEKFPVGLNTFGVRTTVQSGWTATAPAGARYTGIPIQLGTVVLRDFGAYHDVTVQGIKFADENGNGLKDDGELPLPQWEIEFVDSNGVVHRDTTDPNGAYSFTVPLADLAGGGVPLVREVLQSGWRPTFPPGGWQELGAPGDPIKSGVTLVVNFANQPDITPGDDTPTPTRTATPSASRTATTTRTATATPSATPTPTRTPFAVISGRKFEDLDGNGRRDLGEPGLMGWTIFEDADGNGLLNNPGSGDGACDGNAREMCVRTDAGGNYGLPVRSTGTYTVREVARPGWEATMPPPADVVISFAGQSIGDVDFGARRTTRPGGPGDCNGDNRVSVDELAVAVGIGVGRTPLTECPSLDQNDDARVTIDELVDAVRNALDGLPTPTPSSETPSATPTGPATATRTAPPSALPTATRTASAPPIATVTATAPRTATATAPPVATPSSSPTGTAAPTAASGTYCGDPAMIPDNDPAGVDTLLEIAETGAIADLNVSLEIIHAWVGDLRVTLTHLQTGRSVTLVDRPGVPFTTFGCAGEDVSALLDDQAEAAAEDQCDSLPPAILGTLRPTSPLAAFNGEDISGSWRLNVSDNSAASTGNLLGWCIEVNGDRPSTL